MPDPTPTTMQWKDLITEAGLSDRAYLKEFADKPIDKETGVAFLKKLDGAETLIGRKIGIPADDAKAEEIEKFYGTLRPAKVEDYEIKTGDHPDEDFLKTFRTASHAAGLSKRQLAKQVEVLGPYLRDRAKKAQEAAAAADREFEALGQTLFGADRDKVFELVRTQLDEHAPPALKPHIGRLDNNNLALVAGVVHSILKKYVPEEKLNGKGGGGGGGVNEASIREEARKLMLLPEYKDPFSPKHEEIKAKVAALYAQLPKTK